VGEAGDDVTRALVLGGGGVAGIAWETGLLLGLAEAGIDVTGADRVIGTSAGSAVGAQITTGVPLTELFDRQLASPPPAATSATIDVAKMIGELSSILMSPTVGTERTKAIGEYALRAETGSETRRREEIAGRLPIQEWPSRELEITAIDANTGELRVFTPADADEVELVDAVAASCAVPGIRPPVTIGASRYIDGGVRTTSNYDLALGADAVLVVAPFNDMPTADPEILSRRKQLAASASLLMISPDEASMAAFGTNPLDLSTAKPCALAGRAQAIAHADDVRKLWLE
jgi:NTE family protein